MKIKRGQKFPVLDHGYLKVVDWMGDDRRFVEAARASTGGGFVSWDPYQGHPDGDAGLLDFLYRHHHTSPFEMGEFAIEVKAPIFVFREWHRHRTQSFNELSARYTQMPNDHYIPDVDRFVMQAKTNKQGGSAERLSDAETARFQMMIEDQQQDLYAGYEEMLGAGLVREVARVNTPVSRYTVCFCKTDIWNWLHFLLRRLPPGAQYEIRVYAQQVYAILKELYPRTLALFDEYTLYGASLSRTERKLLAAVLADQKASVLVHANKLGLKGRKFEEFYKKVMTEEVVL